MNIDDKIAWLLDYGRIVQSDWGANSTKLVWEPKGNPASYVESCFGGTQDEVFGSLYDNIKLALFMECEILDGTPLDAND